MGNTLLYGIIIAIPAVILSGPLYTKLFKKEDLEVEIPKGLFTPKHFKEEEMPGFGISMFTALIPVILIAFQAIVEIVAPKSGLLPTAQFLGNPGVALLIAVIVGIFTFGLNRGRKMPEIMNSLTESISSIAVILLIIGGGGALKQVLIEYIL